MFNYFKAKQPEYIASSADGNTQIYKRPDGNFAIRVFDVKNGKMTETVIGNTEFNMINYLR